MRQLLIEHQLDDHIIVDSAGTGSWHVGHSPDPRSVAAAAQRGIIIAGQARQVGYADLIEYDLLLAMDTSNWRDMRDLTVDPEQQAKIRRLREFDPDFSGDYDVPDPYYGGPNGFDNVIDLIEAACRGLLDEIKPRLDS